MNCLEKCEKHPITREGRSKPYLDKSFDVITLLEVLEHIHLLTKEKLTKMFAEAGCTKLHFDGVEGHLFMVAAIE